jgi:WD40 repeat protein
MERHAKLRNPVNTSITSGYKDLASPRLVYCIFCNCRNSFARTPNNDKHTEGTTATTQHDFTCVQTCLFPYGTIAHSLADQYELSNPPTDAISSLKFAPNSSTRLIVSSWDKNVYLYDIEEEGGANLIQKFEFQAPVLDVCFGQDDNEAFVGGLDWDVRR